MKKPACPRLFEAEALRDGRLASAETLSFRRHLDSCSQCSSEVAALQTLGERLCNSELAADADELHVRRERTRLLAAFDAKLAPPERTQAARSWLVGTAAAAVLLMSGLFLGYSRGHRAAPAGTDSAVVVHAEGTASWSRRTEGAVEKILLEQGVLSISVDHAPERPRLLVVLPDGELEDIGTRFTVSAEASRTTRVSVESGSVVLRIRGQAPISLGAGDTWKPSAIASACPSCEPARVDGSTSEPLAPPSPAPASPLGSTRSQHAQASSASSGRAAPSSARAAHDEPNPSQGPSLDFRAAMTALDSGDNLGAAARFSTFLSAHPGDARCQDAAYLRVIALQRTGDAGSMKEAAAQYLRRYPNGFRRAEVAELAH